MQTAFLIITAIIAALLARAKFFAAGTTLNIGSDADRRANFVRMLLANPYTAKSQYAHLLSAAAAKYSVPLPLLDAIIHVESSDGRYTNGSSGEIGVMQILPATIEEIKTRYAEFRLQDARNVATNIAMAAAYLRTLYQSQGDWAKTAIRYNSTRVNEVGHPYFVKLESFLLTTRN